MDTNSTDPVIVCQAEQPKYLSVHHKGQEYRLKWEPGKQKFRLHLRHLPRLRDTYYGPDPAAAVQQASQRLPSLLALASNPPTAAGDKPKHLLLTHKGIEYRLTLHKSGEYRRKFDRQDKYFGATPETASDDFYARIDGILAGKDPRFIPAGESHDASNPSFNDMVDDALAYRKSRVGISLSQGRYDNLANKAKIIKECAATVTTQLPNARVERYLTTTRAGDIKAKHLEDLIEKLRERHSLITLDDDLQFLRFVFSRANRRLKLDDFNLLVKETLASVPAHKKEAVRQSRRKYFEREEILALLEKADAQWKAMVLLGINGALEPAEVANLDWSVVDLASGWYRKQRGKVAGRAAAPRLFSYWSETIDALSVQPTRLKGGLVFLTNRGLPWIGGSKRSFHNAFQKLEEEAKVAHIEGRGFKGLRHSFRTFADKCRIKETFCLNLVMGHTQKHGDMGRVYNGQVDDEMVKHYCEFVRAWLYQGETAAHKLTHAWSLQDGKPYFDGKFQGVA